MRVIHLRPGRILAGWVLAVLLPTMSRAIKFPLSDAQESCDFTHRHG